MNKTTDISDARKILIISIGSVISFILISIIVRELYKYHQSPTPTIVSPSHEDIYENNAVAGVCCFRDSF